MNGVFRKTFIFVTVMLVVAAAGWFGRKAYKEHEEAKLLTMARQYEAKKDPRNTQLCLERVLQINPVSVPAYQMIADLLDSAGLPGAVTWREKAAELEPGNVNNLFAWARTAISAQDLKSAQLALSKVDEKSKSTADYHKLAGALAWHLGQVNVADAEYSQVLQLEPANQTVRLDLETIRLVSTNQQVAEAARATLEQTVTDPALRQIALQHLLTYEVSRRDVSQAVVYSKQIIVSPYVTFADKIIHLELLKDAGSADHAAWLASLKQEAAHSPANTFALGHSLAMTEGPTPALHWLDTLPASLQTNLPVPLIITDCHVALKDWNGLLAFISQQNWNEGEFYRLALETLAHRSLNEDDAAKLAWRKVMRLSDHQLDRLTRLAGITAEWGWHAERTDLLQQITDGFPDQKWAANQLMAELYADGKTRELQAFLVKSHAANPDDARIKNNLANILLLRGDEMDEANELAREVYQSQPSDPFFISTYAYSLLLQKKSDEAVKVLGNLKPQYLKIPAIAAYYGVIEAESGHKDVARPYIDRAESAKLLPEEIQMVRLAKAQL